jgi:ribonuclease HI
VTKNNRMGLAAIEAPEALQRPVKGTMRTDSRYLLGGITKWIKGWQLNGWKTAARKPVKDDGLWRGLADATSRHEVTVRVGEGVTLAIRATSAPAQWRGIGEAANMVCSAPVISAGRA